MGSVLSLSSSPPAGTQRAPTSCSPPRGVAANCATLRVARATFFSLGFGLSPIPPKPHSGFGDKAGDLKVAKIPAPAPPQFCRVRAARSGGGPNGPARRPGAPTGRKNNDLFTAPVLRGSSSARPLAPPRAADASLSPRTAIPHGIALLALSSSGRSPANRAAQSTAQISAPCSAQRGGKTGYGFPARGIVAAQSTAQFSAPCPPHCGSACAPPPSRRPLGFHLDFTDAKRVKSLFTRAGDGGFARSRGFSRACAIHLYSARAEIVESLL